MAKIAKVAIIMGSISDLEVVTPCIRTLEKFDIETDVRIISAHRTPDEAHEYASRAVENGVEVIIGVAGKAAHLAGVLAAYTTLPVIALPISTKMMGGLDSLLSMVQMPKDVPVATVGVDAADNAAILAAQILALKYPVLREKLVEFKKEIARKVNAADAELQGRLAEIKKSK